MLPVGEIICGDCLDIMRGWPDGCIDAVITDPPYSKNTVTANTRQGVRNLADLSVQGYFYTEAYKQIARLLKPSGIVLSFADDTFYPIIFACSYSFLQGHGLITWDKVAISFGSPIRKRHELIMYCSKGGGGQFYPSPQRSHFPSVIQHNREKDKEHDAQKPLSLMRDLVQHFTRPDDVILDPFAGSGSTLVAAQQLARQFVGIELNPDYCAIARKRTAQKGLDFMEQSQLAE